MKFMLLALALTASACSKKIYVERNNPEKKPESNISSATKNDGSLTDKADTEDHTP